MKANVETIARFAAQATTGAIYITTSLLVLDALTVDIKPILGGAMIFGLAIIRLSILSQRCRRRFSAYD